MIEARPGGVSGRSNFSSTAAAARNKEIADNTNPNIDAMRSGRIEKLVAIRSHSDTDFRSP